MTLLVRDLNRVMGFDEWLFVNAVLVPDSVLGLIPVGLWAPGPVVHQEQGQYHPCVCVDADCPVSMDTSTLVRQAFNWRAIVPVLASTFVLAPVVAYGLALWLRPEGDPHFLPAIMIMAAQAGTLASRWR